MATDELSKYYDELLGHLSNSIKQIQIAELNESEASGRKFCPISNHWNVAVILCKSLELILNHGLKSKANGIWLVVKDFCKRDVIQYINSLQLVKTNSGKGRAWMYICLNEGSLESYVHCFILNKDHLSLHYNRYAFLFCSKVDLFCTLISGLENLKFRLNPNVIYLDFAFTVSRHATKKSVAEHSDECAAGSSVNFNLSFASDVAVRSTQRAANFIKTKLASKSAQFNSNTAYACTKCKGQLICLCQPEQKKTNNRIHYHYPDLVPSHDVVNKLCSDENINKNKTSNYPSRLSESNSNKQHLIKSQIALSKKVERKNPFRTNNEDDNEKEHKTKWEELHEMFYDTPLEVVHQKSKIFKDRKVKTLRKAKSNKKFHECSPISSLNLVDGIQIKELDEWSQSSSSTISNISKTDSNTSAQLIGEYETMETENPENTNPCNNETGVSQIKPNSIKNPNNDVSAQVVSAQELSNINSSNALEFKFQSGKNINCKPVANSDEDKNKCNLEVDKLNVKDNSKIVVASVGQVDTPTVELESASYSDKCHEFLTTCVTQATKEIVFETCYSHNYNVYSGNKEADLNLKAISEKNSLFEESCQEYLLKNDNMMESDDIDIKSFDEVHAIRMHKRVKEVDNHTKLFLMLEILQDENENIVNVFEVCTGHSEGNWRVAFLMFTDYYIYFMSHGDGDMLFKVNLQISYNNIDHVLVDINGQALQFFFYGENETSKHNIRIETADTNLTRIIEISLKAACVENSLKHGTIKVAPTVFHDSSSHGIVLKKYAVQETNQDQNNIQVYNYVHWADTSSRKTSNNDLDGMLYYKAKSSMVFGDIWRKAYFVLSGCDLLQYNNKENLKPDQIYDVSMRNCFGCKRSKEKHATTCQFEILFFGNVSLSLRTLNEEDVLTWIQALCLAVTTDQTCNNVSTTEHFSDDLVPCVVMATNTKLLLFHEDHVTGFCRTLASVRLDEIQEVSVNKSVCICQLSINLSSIKSTMWTLYFTSESSVKKFKQFISSEASSEFSDLSLTTRHEQAHMMLENRWVRSDNLLKGRTKNEVPWGTA